jgi:hypothetical protein
MFFCALAVPDIQTNYEQELLQKRWFPRFVFVEYLICSSKKKQTDNNIQQE